MLARLIAVSLCVSVTLGLCSPLFSQEPPPEFELPDVVSPSRRPQPAPASPASVSVLTAAELRRLGVRTVGEAIAFLPEVASRAYGGAGGLITASIRGSSAEQVLVLLDGVPLNSVFAGTVDLGTIPVDDIERIEVLRGPFSAIYGSGALGGVISIVTRRRAAGEITLAAGSFGLRSLGITAGGPARLTLRYDAADGSRPNSDLRGGYLSLRLGDAAAGRRWDLSLTGSSASRGSPGSTFFPSPLARQEDARLAAALTLESEQGGITNRLRFAAHREHLAYRDPGWWIDDRHTGTAWTAEWQRAARLSPSRAVTLGADVALQHLQSTSVGERSATTGALYLQDDRALTPRLLLSVGLRADLHSTYGVQVSPRAGLVYFARPDLRLRLAAGRTFRGPTMAELYYPFDGFAVGNPALRPEHAWSVDAGIEASLRPGATARVTVFWSDVRDLILWVPDDSFVFSPQNVGAATIRGASVEFEGALGPIWWLRASSTWLAATDAATGLDLPNRARHSAALALSAALPRGASATASATLIGARFADTANTVTLPAYVDLGLAAEVPLAGGSALRLAVRNLLDSRYEPVQGYPASGRTLTLEYVLRR
ncbi:MAG: TonB-dependent receptor [Armatimonadetes bacterium]|nr:TonB-dependent receptor [Armatimonadota bacterium]